ncbi:MAG: glycine cleavage system protein H, partial [Planctomycetes bacterium]|nr:glycine cleavage system protein H [Planctomycetota bacterium]
MTIPTDRVYSATHEWFLAQDRIVTMGITQYAADELTDITYVELPEIGSSVGPDAPCGGVESVKAYSELYCAVTGRVVEV